MNLRAVALMAALLATSVIANAQQTRPLSPRGTAAAQVGGRLVQEKPDAPPQVRSAASGSRSITDDL